MADIGGLIGGIAEGVAALAEVLLSALLEVVMLVAYMCSRTFRLRKNAEWAGRPARKFFDLGVSTVCLLGLMALITWASLTGLARKSRTARQTGDTNRTVEFQFGMEVSGPHGTNLTLAVDNEGVHRIAAAQDWDDLARRIKENVKIVGVGTNAATTNRSIRFQFRASSQKP